MRRHRFVLSMLLLLLPAVRLAVGAKNGGERSKNDDDVSINSLEDVDLSCDGARCEPDEENASSPSSGWTTTKKPNIFQLNNKSCPGFELPPLFPRQNCDADRDCWPRICCGYGGLNGHKYCRIPLPSWRNDILKTITKKLRSGRPYLQCSPPPPKRYDLFPKKCRSTVDCLPDLCCPEGGKSVCRPPRESVLPFVGRLSVGAAANMLASPSSRESALPLMGRMSAAAAFDRRRRRRPSGRAAD